MQSSSNRGKFLIKLLFLGLISFILVMTIVPRAKNIMELSRGKQELQVQKANLQEINKDLENELAQLDSPEEIERIAREQLGMVKNGEKVIVEVIKDK